MKTLTRRIDLYQLYLTRSIAALAGICVLSVFLYGVFLMLAVEHTASRTALQNKVDSLTVELGSLESQYLQQTREMTPERAHELGFVTPKDTAAVFADADTRSLSLVR